MFRDAISFDQDISTWCVEHIPNAPQQFKTNSPLSNSHTPNWGEECVLSVNTFLTNSFKLYPNPTSTSFSLDLHKHLSNFYVYIFDATGKKVFSQFVSNSKFEKVDVSALETGLYLVEIKTGSNKMTSKLIKK